MRPTQQEISTLLASFEWMPEKERRAIIIYVQRRAKKYRSARPTLRIVASGGLKVS